MTMSVVELSEASRGHPLEVVERIAREHEWSFERACDDEINIVVRGKWADYQVSFIWITEIESLHVACAFELKVPERNQSEVERLISLINAQLWLGHFDLWPKDGLVIHRHGLILAGGVDATSHQCEVLLTNALDACERHYAAFQFVVWAGEGAREALDAAMFETAGRA